MHQTRTLNGVLPRPGSAGQGCARPPKLRASGGDQCPPSTLLTESESERALHGNASGPSRDGGATEDTAAFAFGPTWSLVPESPEKGQQPPAPVCAREAAGASDPEQMLPRGQGHRGPPPTPTAQHWTTHPAIVQRHGETNGASGVVFWGRCVSRRMFVVWVVSAKGSENSSC